MRGYYDDNFGWWDVEHEEDLEWYHQVQQESVEKECEGCGYTVRILPHYGYCNRCADMRESGIEF